MRRAVALLAFLLLSLQCSSVSSADENVSLENIYNRLSLLENYMGMRFSVLENRIHQLENQIASVLRQFVPQYAPSVSVFVIYSDGEGFTAKQVSQGLENILTLRPGAVIIQAKTPSGEPASGLVFITPPLENTLLTLLGGQPSYQVQLSNGMSVVSLFCEGLWMFEVRAVGYPPFTFFLRVRATQQEQTYPRVFINVVGEFAKNKPCIIKAVDINGRTLEGTLRVLDVGNPLGVVEGSNPMTYTPKSSSITVSFLQDGEEKASRTFTEVKVEKKRELPLVPVVMSAVALVALLLVLLWRRGSFKKIKIPR